MSVVAQHLYREDRPRLFGVVHLPALPGAPMGNAGLSKVLERAVADAEALVEGGCDGLVVENFGDSPFAKGSVEPITVAAMTRVALAVREAAPHVALGINVLRNDGVSALSIAAAVGAQFVRVNVLSGAMVTDQGVIEGCARELLMARSRFGGDVQIMADVIVKHAQPLGGGTLEQAAADTWSRGGADALVLTGDGTGLPTQVDHLERAREMAPGAPIWAGSGVTPENAAAMARCVDGAIVGTWLHQEGRIGRPIDLARVKVLRAAFQ